MGDIQQATRNWRWWTALPLMLPTLAAIRLTDWASQVLHRLAFLVWGWVFRGAR